MNPLTLLAVILFALVLAVESRPGIDLAGDRADVLLRGLTNNSTGNSSINLSNNGSLLDLSGVSGNSLMQDVNNASKNMSDWGDKPPRAPLPPGYDSRAAQTYEVLKANHGF